MSNNQRSIVFAALFLSLIVFVFSISNTSDTSPKGPTEYTVKAGDTCLQISDKFQVPLSIIAEQNGLTAKCSLVVGQILFIPAP